jgi:hypothetical protein
LRIPSIHLFFGLPAGLFPNGFQLVSFLTMFLFPTLGNKQVARARRSDVRATLINHRFGEGNVLWHVGGEHFLFWILLT